MSDKITKAQWTHIIKVIENINVTMEELESFEDEGETLTPSMIEKKDSMLKDAKELAAIIEDHQDAVEALSYDDQELIEEFLENVEYWDE